MSRDPSSPPDLLAVEVGSSRIKLGWFPAHGACDEQPGGASLPIAPPRLPEASEATAVAHRDRDPQHWLDEIARWLETLPSPPTQCILAAVDPAVAEKLSEDLLGTRFESLVRLTPANVPIATRLERPEQVGVDRLINAYAASRLIDQKRSWVVIDAGTAITVDLTAADGVFEGGAILPGAHTSAGALYQSTARLPRIEVAQLASPPPVGRATEAAIAAGIYWGTVGAIRHVVEQIAAGLPDDPALLLTGGDGAWLAMPLRAVLPELRLVDHLTLRGIGVIASSVR